MVRTSRNRSGFAGPLGRLPIRARLTAAFALAMVLVLAAAALFVYLRLRADLNETIDTGLRSRADDVAALTQRSGAGLGAASGGRLAESEESFAQVLTPAGRLVDGTSGAPTPALAPEEVKEVSAAGNLSERRVPGVEGTARLLARRIIAEGRPLVVIVGSSLDDRDETLRGVLRSFAIGGVVAVLLASGTGYFLASAGLAPIEAMRRRAARVSLARGGERLPLPPAHDEVRRLGETLNEMLARLQASFERERRFVADASHELRTPLAVLKTELEAALRRGGHSAEVRESLVAAAEEVDHLAQLADDLLLIARAAGGRLPVRPERVRVHEMLERARQRFADRAREQRRSIRVEAPGELEAHLDPLRARQALGNLIDNALRHGAGDIELSARERNGALEVDVSDEGSGFPADLAPRAFERFARGDTARVRGGAGLGLAIVSAIAEAHEGTSYIVDTDGRRTTIRLRLPLSAPSQPGPSP
jgi:signal transduction histidine kinase